MTNKKSVRELRQTEVTHSMALTNAQYSLARDEARMLYLVMTQMQPMDLQTKFEIKVSDYSAIFGVSSHQASREVKAAINSWFKEKYVTFRLADESTHEEVSQKKIRWIISNTNLPKRGSYQVELHPDLLPYLNDLKKNINYPLKDIVSLKNNYQYRFYELFTAHKAQGELEITVEWLRERFELDALPAYKRPGNIKNRIVIPAVENINESTPLNVEFEDITEGRKIVGWRFLISSDLLAATNHPNAFELTATDYPK